MLEGIYSKLAARFPPIFERLVLSYRWAEVDLTDYRLIANPPGTDLTKRVDREDIKGSGNLGLSVA